MSLLVKQGRLNICQSRQALHCHILFSPLYQSTRFAMAATQAADFIMI